MKIIIEPLEKAVVSLEKIVDMPIDDIIRDSTIQRFEYTFELSWKMLKKFLREAFGEEDIEQCTYIEIIKKSAKHGIVSNPNLWTGFREMRNYTSHAYSETLAIMAYDTAQTFLGEAQDLVLKLQEINSRL
jgi:nucleotidyltransferase substrate binding protein (TIGR01987 family)